MVRQTSERYTYYLLQRTALARQGYSLLTNAAYYLLLATYYLLPTTCCDQPLLKDRERYLLPTTATYYLLPTTYYLPTIYYLLPTATTRSCKTEVLTTYYWYLPLTTYCLPRRPALAGQRVGCYGCCSSLLTTTFYLQDRECDATNTACLLFITTYYLLLLTTYYEYCLLRTDCCLLSSVLSCACVLRTCVRALSAALLSPPALPAHCCMTSLITQEKAIAT